MVLRKLNYCDFVTIRYNLCCVTLKTKQWLGRKQMEQSIKRVTKLANDMKRMVSFQQNILE